MHTKEFLIGSHLCIGSIQWAISFLQEQASRLFFIESFRYKVSRLCCQCNCQWQLKCLFHRRTWLTVGIMLCSHLKRLVEAYSFQFHCPFIVIFNYTFSWPLHKRSRTCTKYSRKYSFEKYLPFDLHSSLLLWNC